MNLMQTYIEELDRELEPTRRLLERVPDDQLHWQPHEKSMSIGQLSLHIAQIPGQVAQMLEHDSFERRDMQFETRPSPDQAADLLPELEGSVATAKEIYGAYDAAKAVTHWRFTVDGVEKMNAPRAAVVRSLGMNHWYHHRAQLAVYLRMLGVDVPATYGPSADEDPFANF